MRIARSRFLCWLRSSWHLDLVGRALLVPDADCALGLVDVLPAGAAGPHRLPLDVAGGDVDLHVVRFGQHGDGGQRRVDAALRLGRRHSLDPVPAGFVAEELVHPFARDAEGDLLEPAGVAGAVRDRLDRPALGPGVPRVHVVQVAGEECRLVAALPGPDLHDDLREVLGRIDEQLVLDLGVQLVALGLQPGEFLLGHRAQVGVIPGHERLRVLDRGIEPLQLDVRFDDLGECPALLGDGTGLHRVARNGGVVELLFQLAVAGELLVEDGPHCCSSKFQVSGSKFRTQRRHGSILQRMCR
jgi:hypothetical protein